MEEKCIRHVLKILNFALYSPQLFWHYVLNKNP